jgi:hypothetical protein
MDYIYPGYYLSCVLKAYDRNMHLRCKTTGSYCRINDRKFYSTKVTLTHASCCEEATDGLDRLDVILDIW